MVPFSYKELKAVAKIRKNEGYKRMSEDELLKALKESEKPPKTRRPSPWELMEPWTKNDSDKTQDIRMPYVGNGYV